MALKNKKLSPTMQTTFDAITKRTRSAHGELIGVVESQNYNPHTLDALKNRGLIAFIMEDKFGGGWATLADAVPTPAPPPVQAQSVLNTQTLRHSVYLERLKTGEANKFARFLRDMDKSIRHRLAGHDLTEFSRTRLEKLLVFVRHDLNTIMADYRSVLADNLQELGEYEAGFEARSLGKAVVGVDFTLPGIAQIQAAIRTTPLSVRGADGGKLLEPFIEDMTKRQVTRVNGAIRQGYFEGQTTNKILQTVRGTRKNKFRDGILAVSNREATAITRTAVQHVASVSRMETWKANAHVLEGYRWLSTLDSRTTQICRSLDGQKFKAGEGPLPPIHIQCRSTTVAEIIDGQDLASGRTRASMHGQVDADTTYYEWLKTQPVAFQRDVLGPTRAKLFRDGGLNADEFARLNLGRDFKPLTLAEMREREPLAFARASLDE